MDASGSQSRIEPGSSTEIDVSVIVPFYNAESHLESCIEALLTQSYSRSRYEVILVDNNSTDRSAEIVRRHPRIRLLSEGSQGAYAARNRGVAAARSSLLAFTDADCMPHPEWLQRIVATLREPGVEIVLGGRSYVAGSPLLLMLEAYEAERAVQVFSRKWAELYFGYTNNMGTRRDVFEQYGPFLEVARGADTLFVRRVVRGRPPEVVRHVPDARVLHREMASEWKWLQKKFLYGRSFQQNLHQRGPSRNLTIPEKYSILAGALGRGPCSWQRAGCTVVLVEMGSLCFMAGRASAAMGHIPCLGRFLTTMGRRMGLE